MIITIDGPAASGKTSVSRRVAEKLGIKNLDTGAMYRALTWKALVEKINLDDDEALVADLRKEMVKQQREIAEKEDIVCEGRDCGTVVFPDADLKIFLDASVEERAKRRRKELEDKGLTINFEKIKREIVLRDKKDSSREISPLSKPKDAHVIDTTNMSIEKVIETIIELHKKG